MADDRGEPHAVAFKNVGTRDDGKWIRIVFLGPDQKTEIPLRLAADLVDKLLPHLISVAAEAERRRTGANAKSVYRVRQGAIDVTEDGDAVFDFTVPTGQRFAFEVDRTGTRLLFAALAKALDIPTVPDGTHGGDPPLPRKH